MNAMQQQGGTHLGDGGTGGTRAAAAARQPTFTALDPQRALTDRLDGADMRRPFTGTRLAGRQYDSLQH